MRVVLEKPGGWVESVQAAVGSQPQYPFGVFMDSPDVIATQAVGIQRIALVQIEIFFRRIKKTEPAAQACGTFASI